MNSGANVSLDERTLAVRIPFKVCGRGGRKLVLTPDGASPLSRSRPRVDNTIVKALARAFRWQRLLEDGSYNTVTELAAAERINASYLARVLRLALLAPDIIEAIVDGLQPHEIQLDQLLRPFPEDWGKQRMLIDTELHA